MRPTVPVRSGDKEMVRNRSARLFVIALLTTRFPSDQVEPFCGTYAFLGDTTLFNCMATSIPIQDVEFLNDFYITAIGSTLAPDATLNPFGFTASAYLNPFPDSVIDSASSSASSSVSSSVSSSMSSSVSSSVSRSSASSSVQSSASSLASSSGSSPGTTYTPSHSGLSQGAIDGIAAGVAVIGAFLFGLAGFCCLRARSRKRMAAATHYPPAPMLQQAQPLPSKAFDGYQSVPQHEQQSFQYPGPHQQAQSSYPPLGSAVSPPSTGANDPRFSSANTSLPPYSPGEPEQRQSHYIPPLSPTVTEVEGTMGNPGMPAGVNHRVPTEVDGTMGNPGVPAGGHGIETQLVPGGSPSAAEIDGRAGGGVQQAPIRQPRVTGASMNQPYSEGPYELGHERS